MMLLKGEPIIIAIFKRISSAGYAFEKHASPLLEAA